MTRLKLVAALDVAPVNEADAPGANGRTAQLLAELDRAWGGLDRDLGRRAANCIRELTQQREGAVSQMRESAELLKTALTQFQALRALL